MSDKKLALPTNGRDYTDPDGVDRQQEVFEKRAASRQDAEYNAVTNTRPSTSSEIAHTRGATIDETSQGERVTAIAGDDDKIAKDVAISDSQGNRIDEDNPLAVYQAESPADEVDDFNVAVDVATDAESDHDYTVLGVNFKQISAKCSCSAEAKFELKIETGVATATFDTVDVGFVSVANSNLTLHYAKKVATGVKVRVTRTNLDNQVNNVYSKIQGLEI